MDKETVLLNRIQEIDEHELILSTIDSIGELLSGLSKTVTGSETKSVLARKVARVKLDLECLVLSGLNESDVNHQTEKRLKHWQNEMEIGDCTNCGSSNVVRTNAAGRGEVEQCQDCGEIM